MTGTTLLIMLLLLLLCVAGYVFSRHPTEPLYCDNGHRSQVFKDKQRRIKAKPDRLEGASTHATLIEYKARSGRVYHSDVVQTIAGVLATRANGIHVVSAEVRTRSGSVKTIALADDARLERLIELPLNNARLVMSGGVPEATAHKIKCRGCGYRQVCEFSG